MIWLKVAGISLVVALIVSFEWARLDKSSVRERGTLVAIAVFSWISALLVVLFPEMPGPIRLIEWLYRPFSGLLS
ncbi:hypothetical protein J2TS6_55280 [Paenibacillus albilobatus]|uniref:Uncharacterized protein n=1 Tax=Paenibacillus albilobatus TaxID=2716884 RepID=A0A919XPJ4_9BACL|nr:hypothetical protein J2TS6_55280 [Paenibacillus albilobatus]